MIEWARKASDYSGQQLSWPGVGFSRATNKPYQNSTRLENPVYRKPGFAIPVSVFHWVTSSDSECCRLA
eukprot:16449867-Heterocapsa_arctica.AAC.1